MYWLASYPRSGNTFLRILFKEVYGINTWEGYGKESPLNVISKTDGIDSTKPIIIKTHELPSKTQIPVEKLKTIYLVRDGRDAVISMAYHRCQIVKPQSNYTFNLLTNVLAPFGTAFGGWSKHVQQWSKHADIIIKFEELIANPIDELKKLEKLMGLTNGDYSKIPSFQDLKSKKYSLGSGNNKLTAKQQQKVREKFFRSGKTNTWKEKMSQPMLDVFLHHHGQTLKQLGYGELHKGKYILVKRLKMYLRWFWGFINDLRA
jgi:hypothetical protein